MSLRSRLIYTVWIALYCAFAQITAVQAADWPGCPNTPSDPSLAPSSVNESLMHAKRDLDAIHVKADRIESLPDGTMILTGNVVATGGEFRIRAQRIVYRKRDHSIEAHGNVRLEGLSGESFNSQQANLNLDSHTGFTTAGEFNLGVGHGRGRAERTIFVARDKVRLINVRFTTCPVKNEDWYLKVHNLDIDQNNETGTAHSAALWFKGVPIMYMPYLSFPLGDRRRSGFLQPDFGNNDNIGTYLTLPYYWNLAENYDATFRPRFMSLRGFQLQTEFRYIGKQYQGNAEIEVLPNDGITQNVRSGITYQHKQRFGKHISVNVDYNQVSDSDYFNDFSTQLSATSQTHLPQRLDARYRRKNWQISMLASQFQTIDRTIAASDYPYVRMPHITAEWQKPERADSLNYQLQTQATIFRHDAKENASRLVVYPSLFYPLRRQYGFVVPRIGIYHTGYYARSTGNDTSLSTAVGSLDAGLFFERKLAQGSHRQTQTLEPRLFYVYSPYLNQDTLPNFDTTIPDFNFVSLFRENRFVGSDRVGDANQLTLALKSRVIDDVSGRENLTTSIGQIFYFADRRVSAEQPPEPAQTGSSSSLAGEITTWLGRSWYLRSSALWNPQSGAIEQNNHYLQFQPAKDRILNIGYRFQQNSQELIDISTQWPLANNWTLFARSQYSLKDQRNQDSYAGIQYQSCCWSLRTIASRRLDSNSRQINGIAIQLVFRGLGGIETGAAFDSGPLDQGLFDRR